MLKLKYVFKQDRDKFRFFRNIDRFKYLTFILANWIIFKTSNFFLNKVFLNLWDVHLKIFEVSFVGNISLWIL